MHLFIEVTFENKHTDPGFLDKRFAAWKKQEESLNALDGYLKRAGTAFLTGDQVTIADIHIFHEYTSAVLSNAPCLAEDEAKRPYFVAWRQKMVAIPAINAINDKFMEKIPGLHQFYKLSEKDQRQARELHKAKL